MNVYTVLLGIAFTVEAPDEDEALARAYEDAMEEFSLDTTDRFFYIDTELEDFEVN